MIKKDDPDRDEDFVAILKSQGTVIYIDTWTPTDDDLNELPHVVLTSSKEWDPQKVSFPCSSDLENKLSYSYDAYDTRVIKSLLVPTLVSTGLGYRPSKADPDIWLRPAVKPDGTKYYEMILCYVDDIISISMKPLDAIDGIQKIFTLKNNRADVPEMYLGAGISKVRSVSGTECWTLSSEDYIKLRLATQLVRETGVEI